VVYGHTDLKKDVLIQLDGTPYRVVESSHSAMGRGGAVMRTKLKNLLTGGVVEKSFRSADKIEPAQVERMDLQYLYREGQDLLFMNSNTFDQVSLPYSELENEIHYIPEGSTIGVFYFQGKFLGLDMPNNAWLKVVKTEPGARGDTATAALKPATVETGLGVNVPLFINEGDVIKVDTRSGQYLERQK
jgi:elongation factor P